ncbi:hypothetical protein O6H91_07G129900 [Diphasiastrum complanatum]|uniref:Uncharacterized protein n=1 Tax=Diphasiastrum complanatum TaxID=34168 RepID=A0ACC2DAP3_DIPCM|nr:hypothetical protein O6H91_07G129900 [Diphasiastrum complanatum]
MEFVRCGGSIGATYVQPSTLVLPVLSIGNVGQLAVDLLISSLGAERIGFLEDPNVLPCVGNDPFGPEPEGRLTVALELYRDVKRELGILQQRSPVAKGSMLKYAKNLATWAKSAGFKEIVILSSLDSGKRLYEMADSKIHYISNADEDGTNEHCERLGWQKLDDFERLEKEWHFLATESVLNADEEDLEKRSIDDDTISRFPILSLFCHLKVCVPRYYDFL